MRKPVKKTPSSKMGKPVNKTSSSDENGELNVQQPEQTESSGSNIFRKSEQSESGKEMVDVRGKTKVEASSYQQSNRGGRKIKAGIKAGNNDQKLGERMGKLRHQFNDLKGTEGELVEEKERLESEITAREQQILRKLKLKENTPMDVDSPKDMDSLVDSMEIDLSEGKINAPIPLPSPKELPIDKRITQGTEASQTEISESDINQYLDQLEVMRATNENLKMENARLNSRLTALEEILKILKKLDETVNKIPSACHIEDVAANKPVTSGKGTTKGVKREREDKLTDVPKGKLPRADDGTATCHPTRSTFSSNFISKNICQLILQFATQNHLLSTAGDAESRETTHDEQASTSALGTKGTTDVRELEKHMENSVSVAYYFALEIVRAQRESRAVNAEEEDGDNQAIETADSDN